MARPREFDPDTALDAAIGVFRERGFAGTSTADLTAEMGIGKQSLYDAFGDKAGLYRAALARYLDVDEAGHLAALSTGPRAADGLEIFLARVRAGAGQACLAIGALSEFGRRDAELNALQDGAARRLTAALAARVREAQSEGNVGESVDAREAAAFLAANVHAIRLAGRGGAGAVQLQALAELALAALR